ncbi:glutaredoxin domain-containing protein [Burkholderia ambifaria]|uniref:glutaredoxin domain-containing protein n=1 Tax=Burkholderia ambifaria TaxID=152480 RepID=UPI0021BBEF15|nr:glutaredoxin domain-containing protein [Burkholderia ambifaria]
MFTSNVNRAQRFRARQATFSRLDHRLLMKLDMSKAREGQRVTKPCGTRRAAYRPDCGVLQGPAALTARRRKQLLFDREMDYIDIPLDHKIRGKVLSAVSGSMTAPQVFINGRYIGGAEALEPYLQGQAATQGNKHDSTFQAVRSQRDSASESHRHGADDSIPRGKQYCR